MKETHCDWHKGKCIGMRMGDTDAPCCRGCKHLSDKGCACPGGVPLSCQLWYCRTAEKTEGRIDRVRRMGIVRRLQTKLVFRDHTIEGDSSSVAVRYADLLAFLVENVAKRNKEIKGR